MITNKKKLKYPIIEQLKTNKISIMNVLVRSIAYNVQNKVVRPFLNYVGTPIGKITIVNSILFMLWSAHGLSEQFLIKHFAFQKEDLLSNRFYTAITHAFSHMSPLHFGVNMIALHLMGRRIKASHGSPMIWMLYLGGAVTGSLAMHYLMPYHSIPIPQVGADPSMASFFGFIASLAPRTTAFTLVVPVKFWFLLLMGVFLMIVSDSSCKNLGGLAMGVGLGLMRRPFLL